MYLPDASPSGVCATGLGKAPSAAQSARDPTDPVRVPAGQRLARAVCAVDPCVRVWKGLRLCPRCPRSGAEQVMLKRTGRICPKIRLAVCVLCVLGVCCVLTCRVLLHTSLPACVPEFMGSQGRPCVFLPPKSALRQAKLGLCRS